MDKQTKIANEVIEDIWAMGLVAFFISFAILLAI